MKRWQKWFFLGLGSACVVFVAPIVWSMSGSRGYFYEGRCFCGYDTFVRVQGDHYFKYSPGHGIPEHPAFTLRARDGGWDVLGLPHSDMYYSPLEGENKVIGHIRISEGVLYQSWDSSTNWQRHPRVYNVWRVWAAKFMDRAQETYKFWGAQCPAPSVRGSWQIPHFFDIQFCMDGRGFPCDRAPGNPGKDGPASAIVGATGVVKF